MLEEDAPCSQRSAVEPPQPVRPFILKTRSARLTGIAVLDEEGQNGFHVGLGKTLEAGLIMRELRLRRRIELIVISPPPAMIVQWKDELESKFGLTFDIIDRERVAELRRQRGFSVNPWTIGCASCSRAAS